MMINVCAKDIYSSMDEDTREPGIEYAPSTPLLFVRGDEWGGLNTLYRSHHEDSLRSRHEVNQLMIQSVNQSIYALKSCVGFPIALMQPLPL